MFSTTKLFFAIVFALLVSTAALAQQKPSKLQTILGAVVNVNHDNGYVYTDVYRTRGEVAMEALRQQGETTRTLIREVEETKRRVHQDNTDLAKAIVEKGGCPGCTLTTSYNQRGGSGPSSTFQATNVLAQADEAMCKRAKARGQACEVPR